MSCFFMELQGHHNGYDGELAASLISHQDKHENRHGKYLTRAKNIHWDMLIAAPKTKITGCRTAT
jgi:hypothetical protein